MSAEGMRALLDRAESDEAFRERILGLASPEEKRTAIREAGFDVDESDLDALRAMTGTELSDDDLEQVAGGVAGVLSTHPGDKDILAVGAAGIG